MEETPSSVISNHVTKQILVFLLMRLQVQYAYTSIRFIAFISNNLNWQNQVMNL